MLIATPGRLLDLVEQKIVDLSHVEIFTLDEADKMLNMGFIDDVYKILEYIPNRKQNLFFSATMPEKIETLAGKILSQPVKVEVHTNSSTVDTISQEIFCVEDELKPQLLIYTLQNNAFDSVIIFVKTKDRTEEVLEILQRENISCDHIH
ncbi:MAG: DEAD/DEAH box helicase, partial [Patescibacteria group bacterium]